MKEEKRIQISDELAARCDASDQFQRFDAMVRILLSVPRDVVLTREAEYKRQASEVDAGKMRHTLHNAVGAVAMIDPVSGRSKGNVEITAYNEIYAAMGAGRQEFSVWQTAYGVDSLGRGKNGELFLPEFPIFSKVAWMFVDPVDLSTAETRQLVDECERARANTTNIAARMELEAIREFALMALEQSAAVRFVHP